MAHVKYLYVRVKNANVGHRGDPIACVASVLEGDVLRYSLSVARQVGRISSAWFDGQVKSDVFDKNLARKIALGKLQSPNATRKALDDSDDVVVIWSTVNVTDRTAVGVTKAVFEDLAIAQHAPTHVHRAAQTWLSDFNNRRKSELEPDYAEFLRLKEKFEPSKK